ncbi:66c73cf4-a816-4785-93b1-7cad0ecb417e [Sclerotinia trifoliorum]|uniref:66c73cf4-a816-4785-93b1-7cad0ecb417e n=1 Tax=Sclerotinia trifoliorum TaxID=28548 RepID=A0A8H2VMQ8_9HELO|nr:66c73cf4-a816-4785-93b1-7cad0ecb417e [Sclerotinia trifoliorum]
MGALSAVLAIPYRSIKESIQRNRKNENKNKRQTKSAPGSRTPSIYLKTRESFDRKYRTGDSGSKKSQSLGHLPLVDVPRPELLAVENVALSKGKRKEKAIEEPLVQKRSSQSRTTSQKDFVLDSTA